jgi:hypothetical protein
MQNNHLYCVRCQSEKTVMGLSPAVFANGSLAVKGQCPKCGAQTFRIVKKDALQIKSDPKKQRNYLYAFTGFVLAMGLLIGFMLSRVI